MVIRASLALYNIHVIYVSTELYRIAGQKKYVQVLYCTETGVCAINYLSYGNDKYSTVPAWWHSTAVRYTVDITVPYILYSYTVLYPPCCLRRLTFDCFLSTVLSSTFIVVINISKASSFGTCFLVARSEIPPHPPSNCKIALQLSKKVPNRSPNCFRIYQQNTCYQ